MQQEICSLLVHHTKDYDESKRLMILFTEGRSYQYPKDVINADEIHKDFLSDEKYKKFPVWGGKSYTTQRVIRDGKEYIRGPETTEDGVTQLLNNVY